MNRMILTACLAAALALPILGASTEASASCAGRKMTGTVIGGIGGALLGNSIARGGGGAVIGGVGGAVLGHEIAGRGCGRARRAAYDNSGQPYRNPPYGESQRPAVRYVYYDDRGEPVGGGPVAGAQPGFRESEAPICHTEMRSYYDDRGGLVQSPAQICDR